MFIKLTPTIRCIKWVWKFTELALSRAFIHTSQPSWVLMISCKWRQWNVLEPSRKSSQVGLELSLFVEMICCSFASLVKDWKVMRIVIPSLRVYFVQIHMFCHWIMVIFSVGETEQYVQKVKRLMRRGKKARVFLLWDTRHHLSCTSLAVSTETGMTENHGVKKAADL